MVDRAYSAVRLPDSSSTALSFGADNRGPAEVSSLTAGQYRVNHLVISEVGATFEGEGVDFFAGETTTIGWRTQFMAYVGHEKEV